MKRVAFSWGVAAYIPVGSHEVRTRFYGVAFRSFAVGVFLRGGGER